MEEIKENQSVTEVVDRAIQDVAAPFIRLRKLDLLGWVACVVLAVVASLTLAFYVSNLGVQSGVIFYVAVSFDVIALVGMGCWFSYEWVRIREPETVIAAIRAVDRKVGGEVATARSLARSLDSGGQSFFSERLARRQIDEVVLKLKQFNFDAALRGSYVEEASRVSLIAALLSLLCAIVGVTALVLTDVVVRPWESADRSVEKGDSGADAVKRSLIEKFAIRIKEPEYLGGLPEKGRVTCWKSAEIEQRGGSIEVAEGSRVEVVAELTPLGEKVKPSVVVVRDGEETGGAGSGSHAKFAQLEQGAYSGCGAEDRYGNGAVFYAEDSGELLFRTTKGVGKGGRLVSDVKHVALKVVKDGVPEVTVQVPENSEILADAQGALRFEFKVVDDHGISEIWYEYWRQKREEGTRGELDDPLPVVSKLYEGRIVFDLNPLELKAYDEVHFQIYARDNREPNVDKIAGKSEVFTIRIKSPEDSYDELIVQQKELLETLIRSLANYLESSLGERVKREDGRYHRVVSDRDAVTAKAIEECNKAHKNQELVSMMVDAALSNLLESDLTEPHLEEAFKKFSEEFKKLLKEGDNAFSKIEEKKEGGIVDLANYMGESEDALERVVLQLDAEILSQRMQSAERIRTQISKTKDDLKSMLEEYKRSNDSGLKSKILEEIQRLSNQLQALIERLSDQVNRSIEEHVNEEAVELEKAQSETESLKTEIVKLQQMLENGKIDEAISALNSMTSSLEELTKEIDENVGSTETEEERRYKEKISKLMDAIEDLSNRQSNLAEETREEIEKAARDTSSGRDPLEELKRERMREALEEAAEIRRDGARIQESMRRKGASMERALKSMRRFDLSDRRVRQLVEERFALESEDNFGKKRNRFSVSEAINEPLRQASSHSREDEKMRNSLQDMRADVDQMIDELYEEVVPEAMPKTYKKHRLRHLEQEQENVRKQLSDVQRQVEEMQNEAPELKSKLAPDMESSGHSMDEARKSLGEGHPQQGLDHQRTALQALSKLKTSLSKANKSRYAAGVGEKKEEKVDMGGDRFNGDFRKRVMRGMRGTKAKGYGPQIENYFKSLIR